MLSRAVCRLLRAVPIQACNTPAVCCWFAQPPSTSSIATHAHRLRHTVWGPGACQHASTASSVRWKARQGRDSFAREAKVAGLKSRAAFKLLEIDAKFHIFKRGDTVVDLGYAPGSWSQVAISKTSPGGRVVGIDVIPAQPPKGVSTIQGDFLSAAIREEVRRFVQEPGRGRARARGHFGAAKDGSEGFTEEELEEESRGVIEREKQLGDDEARVEPTNAEDGIDREGLTQKELEMAEGRVVNVVLSDMMMNTSGMPFRDHAGSMDLCNAALEFCYDTLITGGHFLCKFYQGSEDHAFEQKLKKVFEKVHRIKPDSSRKESKEAYLLGLRRRAGVRREDVEGGKG